MTKITASGSISQRHGSTDPDPDPHQNVMIRNTGQLSQQKITPTRPARDAIKTQRWANNDMTCLCNQMHKKA